MVLDRGVVLHFSKFDYASSSSKIEISPQPCETWNVLEFAHRSEYPGSPCVLIKNSFILNSITRERDGRCARSGEPSLLCGRVCVHVCVCVYVRKISIACNRVDAKLIRSVKGTNDSRSDRRVFGVS